MLRAREKFGPHRCGAGRSAPMRFVAEGHQLALLQALVRAEEGLRRDGLPTDFMLLQMPGPSFGFKPAVPGSEALHPTEGDILDHETAGYVHTMSSTSSSVLARFSLTSTGRVAGTAPA